MSKNPFEFAEELELLRKVDGAVVCELCHQTIRPGHASVEAKIVDVERKQLRDFTGRATRTKC